MGDLPVGGRLRFFADLWQNSFYHKNLREGLRFRWVEDPPDMDMGEEVPDEEEDRQALFDMNQELLKAGAVEVAPQVPRKGCIFKMFLVDKKGSNEKRPVVNMRPLSPYVASPHFKMEGLNVARELIEQGDWFARLDLKDAYLHVPLHPLIRLWFRYRVQGTLYQWCTLPFGFRDAPRTFQKLVVEAVTPLRQQGVRLVVYLDDILVIASSQSQCRQDIRKLVALLLRLGFVINLAKSELTPSQQKVFLGTLIDSLDMKFFLPRTKVKTFKERIVATLKKAESGEEASLEEIQSIVGTLGSTTECIAAIRLRLNALIEMQNKALHSRSGQTPFTDKAISDLRWWRSNLERKNGKPIFPPLVDITFDVDASNKGLGAILLGEGEVHKAHRFFSEEDPTHINERELLAAEYGLKAFTNKLCWKDKRIRIRTDNTVALSYINKMGGKVPSLSRIAERIHSFALKHRLLVAAEWIPSEANLADGESRIEGDLTDWKLNPKAFALVVRRFGKMDLDLFASNQNTQTPLFVSLKADPEALYVDAFSRRIPPDLQVFANPPFILLPRLLSKIRRERTPRVILLAPVWPSQPWWPTLLRMLRPPPPLLLPRSQDLYLPPRGRPSPSSPSLPKWRTIVCHVSGTD